MKKSPLYQDTNLQIVFAITLMAVLGVSSITPAFPVVIRKFKISAQAIGLLITVFTLPGIFLTPVLGVLADRLGRKKILIPSLFLFGIAGMACGWVRDYNLLLVLRFFQGAGAAALGSLNVTIIGDLFSGNRRATAMGYNAGILSVGTATYPAIGGFLASVGWFYPFFLPVLALPIGLWVIFSLKNPEPKNSQDLNEYLRMAFKSIKSPGILVILAVSIITFIILYGTFLTFFPLYISDKFGGSPLVIGLLMSVLSVATGVSSSLLGKLTRRVSKYLLIRLSYLLFACSMILFVFIPSLWLLTLPIIIFGVGHGINYPAIQVVLAEAAPLEYRGAFMSIYGMVLRVGQTLGPILMGLAFALWGIKGVFYSGAGFAFLAFLLVMTIKSALSQLNSDL